MFGNLIESGSHQRDFKRKGKFFLGTLVFYSMLLVAAGVGSIYAYNVRLEDQNELELQAMLRFPTMPAKAEPERTQQAKPAASSPRSEQFARRPEISIQTPYKTDRVASLNTKEVSPRTPVMIDSTTSDPTSFGGPAGPQQPGGGGPGVHQGSGGPVVLDGGEAPEVKVKPTPAPVPVEKKTPSVMSLGVINGRAIEKPAPVYPPIAKQARAAGTVTVHIVVDENGRVLSAQATNGHPMLLKASVDAAYRARFSPTLLSNKPVKVSGVITYNFVLN